MWETFETQFQRFLWRATSIMVLKESMQKHCQVLQWQYPRKEVARGTYWLPLQQRVCALHRGMVQRHLNLPPQRYRSLWSSCEFLLLPASAQAEWLRSVEDVPSWTQQLSPLLSACSRCAGSRRLIPWQLLNQRRNYGHTHDFICRVYAIFPRIVFFSIVQVGAEYGRLVHQQLNVSSCCKYTTAIQGKQEILIYSLKQQSETVYSEKRKKIKQTGEISVIRDHV